MGTYNSTLTGASKTLTSAALVKLFAAPSAHRVGWRVWNPSATQSIVFVVVPVGESAPSYAAAIAGAADALAGPYATVSDGARADCDVYACLVSGADLAVIPKELL